MMIHLTKTELTWIVDALRDRAEANAAAARLDVPEGSPTHLHKALFKLRSEQLTSIADRMEKAATNGSKRIAID